jgi:hypothetical protein
MHLRISGNHTGNATKAQRGGESIGNGVTMVFVIIAGSAAKAPLQPGPAIRPCPPP